MVHFVGAGPGAPDLITVRGLRLLQRADLVIYAGSLVNPALLDYTRPGVEIYDSAKLSLPEITEIILSAYRKRGLLPGEPVPKTLSHGEMPAEPEIVRLQTGDISLYSAIREQIEALAPYKIRCDICPGLGAMQASAAALSLEYTEPGVTQSVILTRAEGRTKLPPTETLRLLAAHKTTLVLYLSSSLTGKVQAELLAAGLSEDTPVGVVYKASWPEERVYRCRLSELPSLFAREGLSKTALIIVGEVLNRARSAAELSRLYDASFTTEYREGKAADRQEAGEDVCTEGDR